MENLQEAYSLARDRYQSLGVDTDKALKELANVAISLNCWNGDDVTGFEYWRAKGSQNVVSGNFPGRARNIDELRADLEIALRLIPAQHRVSLHACYLDSDEQPDRDALLPRHFLGWTQWAKDIGLQGLDFNPTFFSHPLAAQNLTLAHPDAAIRDFWIEHARCCRKISAALGQEMGNPCLNNTWIIDGYKDRPVDRLSPRERLLDSLNKAFQEPLDKRFHQDVVESKLFSIAVESYTVGSHEFYLSYAQAQKIGLCLDSGHFHPTETVSNKLSSILPFVSDILLHVSRPVRWDSDHIVLFEDELAELALEYVRHRHRGQLSLGLDFFDASVNRIAGWIISTRALQQALLYAFLEPREQLRKLEIEGDYTSRLALLEEQKMLPFAAVWDYFCLQHNVPIASSWLKEIKRYEQEVLFQRQQSQKSWQTEAQL